MTLDDFGSFPAARSFFRDLRMTRLGQDDDGHAPPQRAKSIVVEFSKSPPQSQWEESTPSQDTETKSIDRAVQVRAIVDVETRPKAPARIADRYDVLGELGAGGQANVYLAEDTTLRRKVAIKMPRAEHPLSKQ